ncbi:MAG: metalloregulator ArsR/SmtB family transcription factor [Bacillota bacterium]|nr:metalloregulator ArsR/SmtB family transcription factor [Bacillota bacterium]
MNKKYMEAVPIIKALADETRLEIVDMLLCGELSACKILEKFDITQPTLSYHMKILTDSGLVLSRRAGAWTFYRLNKAAFDGVSRLLNAICGNLKEMTPS